MSDHVPVRLPGPLIWTVAGTSVAVIGFALPQLWWGMSAMQAAYDVPFIAVALVALFAQRSLVDVTQPARLKAAAAIAAVISIATGVTAYWLYQYQRPDLLAAKWQALARTGPVQGLVDRLDARAEALQLAAAILLVGFIVGSFVAFRRRVAERHRQRGT